MKKKQVVLLYGGRSVEHGVSINSAKNVARNIDKTKFEVFPIGITQSGKWFFTPEVSKLIQKGSPVVLNLETQKPYFNWENKRILADVVFPLLHGTNGEDGSIQGFFKTLNLPVVGSDILGSSLAINKIISKRLLHESGLPVANFISIKSSDKTKITFAGAKKKLGLPFMVKAASLGSSIGISKVKLKDEFIPALESAFRYDTQVLLEQFIEGRELECAVLFNNPPKASLPGEVVVNKNYDFYTFEAKYVDPNAVTIQVPAILPAKISKLIRELSVKAFQALQCEDYARVDLFLTKNGSVYINEINTIPGFTDSSMFPMLWKQQGISFENLITKLIEIALEKNKSNSKLVHNFNSNLKY